MKLIRIAQSARHVAECRRQATGSDHQAGPGMTRAWFGLVGLLVGFLVARLTHSFSHLTRMMSLMIVKEPGNKSEAKKAYNQRKPHIGGHSILLKQVNYNTCQGKNQCDNQSKNKLTSDKRFFNKDADDQNSKAEFSTIIEEFTQIVGNFLFHEAKSNKLGVLCQ